MTFTAFIVGLYLMGLVAALSQGLWHFHGEQPPLGWDEAFIVLLLVVCSWFGFVMAGFLNTDFEGEP